MKSSIHTHPHRLSFTSKVLGKMSQEDFILFCHEQRELRVERNEEGEIEVMAPAYSLTGRINAEINRQLANWNVKSQLGLVFDSSAGFLLDRESQTMRSPDASFLFTSTFNTLSAEDKEGFLPLCPDFIIELKSTTDSLSSLQHKMEKYIAYGTQLGWLIDIDNQIVYIYQADGVRDVHKGFDQPISADPILTGFSLDLGRLIFLHDSFS